MAYSSDSSLYELAVTIAPAISPVQVSPATFKALVMNLGAWLGDWSSPCSSPLTLWVKLPSDPSWHQDLHQQFRRPQSPHQVYWLKPESSGSSLELPPQESAPPLGDTLAQGGTESEPDPGQSSGPAQIFPLPLPGDTLFKREYFLLVIGKHCCGLILAHRPRSGKQDPPSERRQLLLLSTFSSSVVQPIFTEIQQSVSQLSLPFTIDWDGLQQSLSNQRSSHPQESTPAPSLGEQLLLRQIADQEEIWQRMVAYRKQAEVAESLQIQHQGLLDATRIKDEFIQNLGQELRTPLTNMKTALTLLNSPQLKQAQRQRYMQLLSTECDRQGSIISGILALVQLDYDADREPLQSLHLCDIVPAVVSTYQPLTQEKGIMLAYTIPENLPPVLGMGSWLKQIVVNLVHNSIKFTPKGGQVWVRAKQQGDYIQLEFRDTGIGIPSHEIPRIFDRFYRSHHTGIDTPAGAGLGLTITQQILLRCGGSISVKSKLGEGSIFNVLLPIYHPPSASLLNPP